VSESIQRGALLFFGALNLALGAIMAIDPGYFFEHIGKYGAENDHYIGDVSAFYLAAGIGLLIAAQRRSWRVPVCVVAALWYGFHAINHLLDVGIASSRGRGWSDSILLAIGAAAFALLAKAAGDDERAGTPGNRRPAAIPERPADYPPGD
jgi:hypothetical protein